MSEQTFIQTDSASWLNLEQFPGTSFLPLAEPVPKGSIHLLKMKAGTIIPLHTHPCDEYVYVLNVKRSCRNWWQEMFARYILVYTCSYPARFS